MDIKRGALFRARAAFHGSAKKVETWEQFFNGDSLKNRLVSRYLYEHLFIAHLYFEDASEREFFDLVRSKTPPGKPIDVIATRRPYGNPGVDRVYYRLRRVKSAIALKRHLPYALSAKRMKRYQELFLNPAYKVTALPSYEPKLASNPFATFREIPPVSRYKFLLDEAQYTIMNFIKGPVCRGQIALNVIRDNFWVVFLDPDVAILEDALDVLTVDGADSKALPAESGSNAVALANWLRYAELQKKYLIKKAKFAEKELYGKQLVNMNLIWDGDGENQNAALTIFRHFDNATVVKGLVGDKPQTAWIMGFSLLERIHYLLVAGFDIYGNVGHQLNTRLYMDFLRMEGESNFLGFLPKEQRAKVRDDWYRDARAHVKEYVYGDYSPQGRVDIKFVTDDPKNELLSKIEQRLQKVLPRAHALDRVKDGKARRELERLEQIVGKQVSVLPQLSFLSVKDVGVFTLINNSFHKSISHMFFEQLEREPEKDTLSVAYGFIGAHPNAFYVVEKDDLSTFVDAIDGLRDEDSYAKLVDRFGVRRNDPRFWAISDELHERFAKTAGVEAGIFDYNRYENR